MSDVRWKLVRIIPTVVRHTWLINSVTELAETSYLLTQFNHSQYNEIYPFLLNQEHFLDEFRVHGDYIKCDLYRFEDGFIVTSLPLL